MKKHILTLLTAAAACLLGACRKDIPQLNRPEDWLGARGHADEFEMFWSAMNHNYVFWDVDPTDWDEVYRTYRPKFEALDRDKVPAGEEIRKLYEELTSTLIDGHYVLVFKDNTAIMPFMKRKEAEATPMLWREYPNEFLAVCRRRMREPVVFKKGGEDGEPLEFMAVSGLIEVPGGTVPYFFFSAFELRSRFGNGDGEPEALFNNFLQNIARPDVKGVILDVRGNLGGDAREPGYLLGYLTNREYTMAYSCGKAGEGRLDYTPWTPWRVRPQENATGITAPVVILADGNSESSSELTVMGVKSLPSGNGVFLGKTTHGGQGNLTLNTVHNGGQFSTATMFNGLDIYSQDIRLVYTSSAMTKTAFDGKIYEGKGLPPDKDQEVTLDLDRYVNDSYDTQLERAIEYIKNR